MVNLADQLAAAGAPILDSDLVSYILSGLGTYYNSFIVALTTRSDLVSLADLHGFLLSHENLLSAQLRLHSSDPVALYSSHSSRGRGRGSSTGRRGSNHSSGRGSASQQGLLSTLQQTPSNAGRGGPGLGRSQTRGSYQQHYSGRGAASSTQVSTELPVCQVCHKKGHEALDCWYHYDSNYFREAEAQY